MSEKNPYHDLIHLPNHRSKVYPPMSREKRAAQFSPFAALSGHGEAIEEKARLTEPKINLTEAKKAQLNAKLLLLKKRLTAKPQVTLTYFVPDQEKSGGTYVTESGRVSKIGEYERTITFNEQIIPMTDIFSISGPGLESLIEVK